MFGDESLLVYLLEFAKLLESVDKCLLPNSRSLQPLFFQYLFSIVLLLLLFFWDSEDMNVRPFLSVLHVPEDLFMQIT